jgi:hypothetical protein
MRTWAVNIVPLVRFCITENCRALSYWYHFVRETFFVSFSRCQSRYDLNARNEDVFHWFGVPAVIRVHETNVEYHWGAVLPISFT